MFKFFDSLMDFIFTIWNLVVNTISSLINAIVVVTQATTVPLRLISYVPAVIGASITLVVAIGVIKLVLGWGNS